MEFVQSKFWVQKKFIFNKDGIEFYSKEFGAESMTTILYSKIEPQSKCRIYTESYPLIYKIGLVICAIFLASVVMPAPYSLATKILIAVTGIMFGIATIISFYFIQIKYYLIELEDETQMWVIINAPNKDEVQQFVDVLFENRKQNYRKNYFKINYDNLKEKELDRMKWLRSENIITEAEYQVVAEEVEDKLFD